MFSKKFSWIETRNFQLHNKSIKTLNDLLIPPEHTINKRQINN